MDANNYIVSIGQLARVKRLYPVICMRGVVRILFRFTVMPGAIKSFVIVVAHFLTPPLAFSSLPFSPGKNKKPAAIYFHKYGGSRDESFMNNFSTSSSVSQLILRRRRNHCGCFHDAFVSLTKNCSRYKDSVLNIRLFILCV